MKRLILPAFLCFTLGAGAQLYIDNATFFIDNGAVVTVQGDVFSNVDIQAAGTGKIRMGGTTAQNINLNGKVVPNLQIDNSSANIILTGAAKVSNVLEFTNGKIQLANFDLSLTSTGSYTGAAAGKFAETNGTGVFKKEITAAGNYTLPIGIGSSYTPLEYQLTAGSYSSAFVGARAVAGGHPNKHPRSTDYINNYWKLSNSGITGGTKVAVGTYAAFTGTESDIRSMYWNGTTWVIGTAQDVALNTVTAPVAAATNELYGMNKFLLVSPKIFLEGAFDQATGLMKDALRTNGVIPTAEPYNGLAGFTEYSNPVPEVIAPTVLNNQASAQDNIVDWVFLELRSNGSPSVPIQTRSALVQRDGDIVDIDGTSAIYFKNLPDASYNLFVRHRNHLGVRTNAALALTMTSTPKNFTAAVSSAYNDASITTNPPMKVLTVTAAPDAWTLYGSNANADAKTTKIGAAAVNDYSILLANINAALGYYKADYNMDGKVQKTGPAAINDYSKLLGTLNSLNTVTQHNN